MLTQVSGWAWPYVEFWKKTFRAIPVILPRDTRRNIAARKSATFLRAAGRLPCATASSVVMPISLRSLSARRIFWDGSTWPRSVLDTTLIFTLASLANFRWLPARLISERSNRKTSCSSSTCRAWIIVFRCLLASSIKTPQRGAAARTWRGLDAYFRRP